MRLFSQTFELNQGIPPSIVLIICHTMEVKKSQGPPYTFCGTVTLFKILIFSRNFFINVSKGFLLQFFDIFLQIGFSKIPKGPRFTNFGIVKCFKSFSARYIWILFFKTGDFLCNFFSNLLFINAPQLLVETKPFTSIEDS